MNQEALEKVIKETLKKVNAKNVTTASPPDKTAALSVTDYPLGAKHPELVKTQTNKSLADITLENVWNDKVKPEDVRVTAETLRMQAQIAKSAGRETLAHNFERAAELTVVPDETILDIYNALRPYRSSKAELEAIANQLEVKYGAVICARFVREAAMLYGKRKKLKGDN